MVLVYLGLGVGGVWWCGVGVGVDQRTLSGRAACCHIRGTGPGSGSPVS